MNRATGDLEQLECLYTEDLGYPGFPSPTTDRLVLLQTKIYSPAGSMNRATGDLEKLDCSYRGEVFYV